MSSYPCNFTPQSCEELTETRILTTETKTRVDNLESWQKSQNGHLSRIDGRLDGVLWWLIGILASSTAALIVGVIQLWLAGHK